jgi:hypothetical protein
MDLRVVTYLLKKNSYMQTIGAKFPLTYLKILWSKVSNREGKDGYKADKRYLSGVDLSKISFLILSFNVNTPVTTFFTLLAHIHKFKIVFFS